MVISNLNTTRILELIRYIEGCLQEIQSFSKMSKEEFLSDRKNPPFLESYLRRALEAVFDIGRHILAKTYGFREIEYKAIAKQLGEKRIVTRELSHILLSMAGYRNRMVHFYKEVTAEEFYSIAVHHVGDLERFNQEIATFIKAYEEEKRPVGE